MKVQTPPFHPFIIMVSMGVMVPLILSCGALSPSKKDTDISLDRQPPSPAVGQAFYYKHTGPRPWSDGRQDASGGRLVVVSEKMSSSKPLWKYEEYYEVQKGTEFFFLDEHYRLHRQVLPLDEYETHIDYSPPWDVRFLHLKKNNTMQDTFSLTISTVHPSRHEKAVVGTGKFTLEVERRYDVRIITPAGAYLCRQFLCQYTRETVVNQIRTSMSAHLASYWCDDIGWFVKEEYQFNPVIRNGVEIQPAYQAESILVQFKPMDPRSIRQPPVQK